MKKQRFIELISPLFRTKRVVTLSVESDRVQVRGFSYLPSAQKIKNRFSFSFSIVSEEKLFSRAVISLLHTAFFPFPYTLVATYPSRFFQSRVTQFPLENKKKETLSPENLLGYFSQALWKFLEPHKKSAMKKGKYDDAEILLTLLRINSVYLDKIPVMEKDVWERETKKVMFHMIHTFTPRSIFSVLEKSVPRRTRRTVCFEEGFPAALCIYENHQRKEKTRSFIIARIKERETDIFLFDGSTLGFFDSFLFGVRNLYETANTSLGIDFVSFSQILDRYVHGNLSPKMTQQVKKIMEKELANFENGLRSFKESTGASMIYIDGGILSPFLAVCRPKLAPTLLSDKFCDKYAAIDVSESGGRLATLPVFLALAYEEIGPVTDIALRAMRWLMPRRFFPPTIERN